MLTILFDESDRQTPAPAFRLQSSNGEMVALSDYYERSNLVLIFIPEEDSSSDQAFLKNILNQQARFERENARLLALYPQPIDDLVTNHPSNIPMLIDSQGTIRAKYTGLIAPDLIEMGDFVVFILDSFGAPYVCLVGSDLDEPIVDEILSWLLYISIQCPE
jgi:peroxiredoxin